MSKSLFSFLFLLLFLFLSTAVRAELRDVVFAAEEQTAKLLFSFDQQPDAVKVIMNEQGMDVDVLGVSSEAMTMSAANSSLIHSMRTIPAPGGLRIRLVLSDTVLSANAKVYQNSVLVAASFPNHVAPPKDALSFTGFVKPVAKTRNLSHVEHNKAKTKPVIQAQVKSTTKAANPAKHGNDHTPADSSLERREDLSGDDQKSGHDGSRKIKRAPVKKPVGSGMIREASLRAAGSLTPRQCEESEQIVKADPWALDNLAKFGSCLAVEGKSAEAREVFERLLTFDPETFAAYVGLGAIAQDSGEIETARQYYEEALSLGGTDAEAAQVRSLLRSLANE